MQLIYLGPEMKEFDLFLHKNDRIIISMEDIFILNCFMTLILYIQFFGSVSIHLL